MGSPINEELKFFTSPRKIHAPTGRFGAPRTARVKTHDDGGDGVKAENTYAIKPHFRKKFLSPTPL